MKKSMLSVRRSSYKLILLITIIYSLRLVYCYLGYLKNYQWLDNTDEAHIYLLGLKYYTTGQFPLWGPDIVYTHSYMVGGLQGLLVGLPLFLWHHPFAPYLFLFLLVSTALLYLSWYIGKLFPAIPAWVIYILIAISPFSVHTGLKIINPAYVLCFAIPFMLSFIEIFEVFKKQYIQLNWRFFWMGLGVTTIFQLHASWVVVFLLAFTAMVYYFFNVKNLTRSLKAVLWGSFGLLIGFLPIIPVLYHYGVGIFFQESKVVQFSFNHIIDLGALIYSFLMVSGYEMNTFSSAYTWNSLIRLNDFTGAGLFALLQISGFILFGFQVFFLFVKKWRNYIIEYKKFLKFCIGIILPLAIIYMFSSVPPLWYRIVVLYPLSMIYFFWVLNYGFLTNKINSWHIRVFSSLVVVYYLIVINVTRQLPSLGYRTKSFAAIQKKDANLFETSRFIDKPNPGR